jgi:hypothetical protein
VVRLVRAELHRERGARLVGKLRSEDAGLRPRRAEGRGLVTLERSHARAASRDRPASGWSLAGVLAAAVLAIAAGVAGFVLAYGELNDVLMGTARGARALARGAAGAALLAAAIGALARALSRL